MNEKVIEVKNLSAKLDGTDVLRNVSFSALKGEITVLLGESGSGKTTLLRHLLGLYPAQQGFISLLGQDITLLTEKEQIELYMRMGVFYQNGALLNSLSVAENISLPLVQHSDLPPQLVEDIVYMKLGLVNLENAYHLYPSQLSGGMLKRVALARAIVMDPPLLFCDEPGAGLDPVSLESLDNLILNLKDQLGMSVLMVTHEVSSILRIANRVVFLDQGEVVFEGNLREALSSDIQAVDDFFSIYKKGEELLKKS
jgi:phospholipid/cholesterol/gamma-HCH transport system ATP-binding protein